MRRSDTSRYGWQHGAAATAAALLIAAAYCFRSGALHQAGLAAILTLLGGALLGLALSRRADPILPTPQSAAILPATGVAIRPRWRRAIHTCMLSAGVLLLVLLIHSQQAFDTYSEHWQLVFLIAGGMLVAAGLDGVGLPRRYGWNADFVPLALLCLLAFGLRAGALEHTIPRFVDELHSISAVTRLWEPPAEHILRPHGTVTTFPWVYTLLQERMIDQLGATLTGLRMISALSGTLTVITLWLLARELFDRRTAYLAALMLACFPPHIHFSRLGLNNIADPLFGTLALFILLRALRTGRGFGLAGVLLGFGQYFYEGGRLLYPPLAAVLLTTWLAGELRKERSIAWRDVLRFCAAFVLSAAPLYVAWHNWGLPFAPRLEAMALATDERAAQFSGGLLSSVVKLGERWIMALWTYTQHPPRDWFYGGETGLVIAAALPFFLAGCWLAVWRLHVRPQLALILFWLAAAAMGNALLENVHGAARFVVAFPAIALGLALGIIVLVALLVPRRQLRLPRGRSVALPLVAVAGVSGALALIQVGYYFRVHVPAYNQEFAYTIGYDDMLWHIGDLPPDTRVHIAMPHTPFLDDYNITTMLHFHRRQHDITYQFVAPDALDFDYLQALNPQFHHAVFVSPIEPDALRIMAICCAERVLEERTRPIDPMLQYPLYLIEPTQIPEYSRYLHHEPPTRSQRHIAWAGLCGLVVAAAWLASSIARIQHLENGSESSNIT